MLGWNFLQLFEMLSSVIIIEIEQDNPAGHYQICFKKRISRELESQILSFVNSHYQYFAHALKKVDLVRINLFPLFKVFIIICRQPFNGVWLMVDVWSLNRFTVGEVSVHDARNYPHFLEIVDHLKSLECPCCTCFNYKYTTFIPMNPNVTPMFWND